jgi:hypothetical protein
VTDRRLHFHQGLTRMKLGAESSDIRQKEEPHVTVGPLKDQAKPILGRRPASEPTLEAVSHEKKGATTK